MTPNLILLIPDKRDVERDAVAQAWEAAGGEVVRVGRFWDPPAVDAERVRVYGNDTFCLVLAEKLGLDLVTPDDRLMCAAGPALLRRTLAVESLGDALQIGFPAFVKPVVPKQFAAAVYGTASELMAATPGLPDDTEVFVSEIVSFKAEARSFVLDGTVRTCAIYEGVGSLAEGSSFAARVAVEVDVPATCVVDVGLLPNGDWALIEFNATWGAGLNGCDPRAAVECIERSCKLRAVEREPG